MYTIALYAIGASLFHRTERTIFIPYFTERNGPNLFIKYSLNHSRGIQMSLNATKTLVLDLV